jgi:hypothetical protein
MRSRGGTLQATFNQDLFKHQNNLVVGVSYDNANVHFASDTELARLTDDRGTEGSGIFVDESKTRLHTNTSPTTTHLGVFGVANKVIPGFDDGCFVSPSVPRAGWIGVRLSL